MKIAELVALAKVRSGKTQKEMALDMGYTNPAQMSKLASGLKAADASEILYLANAAQMEPIKVLADFETERHPELAAVWRMTIDRMKSGITSLYFLLGGRAHRPLPSAL
jgi:transcriptional regulator with XRE-family HTH domain